MFLNRQDSRKEREVSYRQELKHEIDQKNSKVSHQKVPGSLLERESFSLIANIEKNQEERKKKNSNYYSQLREQIEKEKQIKKEQKALQLQEEKEQEDKLREQQQRLKERYNEQLKREKNKGKEQLNNFQNRPAKLNKQTHIPSAVQSETDLKLNEPRQRIYSLQTPSKDIATDWQTQMGEPSYPLNLYPNKAQNETLKYLPRQSFKRSYFQQILGQRRKLDEETHHISQLNRVMNFQKFRKREESRGLEELRTLQKLLEDKNTGYLGLDPAERKTLAPSDFDPSNRTVKAKSLVGRRAKDEWRKLD